MKIQRKCDETTKPEVTYFLDIPTGTVFSHGGNRIRVYFRISNGIVDLETNVFHYTPGNPGYTNYVAYPNARLVLE